MRVLKKIKNNLFLIIVVLAYIVATLIKPQMGLDSLKNSIYYIKEMLIIMPVIFILTALLDAWVPKEKIMQLLGKEAKGKGILLSFLIGSVSAGPIYAAFPMCVMLRKKGASIRNIIIILSSWAVIKIPMLLNEAKFLGFNFMIVRWILTVLAILIFSIIADKMIKEKDMPQDEEKKDKITINKSACMGCSVCVEIYPEMFEMENNKAVIKIQDKEVDKERALKAAQDCPVNAIEIPEE